MAIFLAAFAGANTVLTRFLNASYAERNGVTMGTLNNYVTGLLTSLMLLLVMGEPATASPVGALTFRTVLMFLGGAVGVFYIELSIYITPRLPAFLATLLIFLSQLAAGLIIDYVISGEFSLYKLLGGALVLVGLAHYQYVNKKAA